MVIRGLLSAVNARDASFTVSTRDKYRGSSDEYELQRDLEISVPYHEDVTSLAPYLGKKITITIAPEQA